MAGPNCPCQMIYLAVSSIFSINIPYPSAGLFIKTWVTAPTSFPSYTTGEPHTHVSIYDQLFPQKLGLLYPKICIYYWCKGGVAMNIDINQIVSISEANQNFSRVARMVDKNGAMFIFKNNKPKYKLIDIDKIS